MPFMLSDYATGYRAMGDIQQETAARKGLQEAYANMPAADEAGSDVYGRQIGFLQQQRDRAGRSGNVKLWQMLNKQLDDTMGKQAQYEQRSAAVAAKKNAAIGSAANAILESIDPSTGRVSEETMTGIVSQLSESDPEKAKNLYINWKAHGGVFTPEMQRGLRASVAQSMSAKDLSTLWETQARHQEQAEEAKTRIELAREARRAAQANAAASRELRKDTLDFHKQEFEYKKEQAAKKEKRIGKLSDPKEVERTSSELKQDYPKLSLSDRDRAAEDIRTRQKELMREDDTLSATDAYDQAYDEITSQVGETGGTHLPIIGTVGAKTSYKKGKEPSAPKTAEDYLKFIGVQ